MKKKFRVYYINYLGYKKSVVVKAYCVDSAEMVFNNTYVGIITKIVSIV